MTSFERIGPTGDWPAAHPDARVALLASFLTPHRLDMRGTATWSTALGRSAAEVVGEMVAAGDLELPPLIDHLTASHSGAHLKELAKQHGVPHSGRKAHVASGLVAKVPDAMRAAIASFPMYVCTPTARERAESYRAREAERAAAAIAASLTHVRAGRYQEASLTVSQFEAARVFSRGMGIDWSRHSADQDVEVLQEIFSRAPALLSAVPPATMDECQVGAAMMNLWGVAYDSRWCPDAPPVVGAGMPMDVAVRMVLFGANQRMQLMQLGRLGISASRLRVRVRCVDDIRTCDACRAADGPYELDSVPEIPISLCTCEVGCRCGYSPDIGNF